MSEENNIPENWQFRKQQMSDWQSVMIPKNAKDVQIVIEDEAYQDYNNGDPFVKTQKVYYVIWLEKVD